MLPLNNESDARTLHTRLAKHNISRTTISAPTAMWEEDERTALETRILEGHYLEGLRKSIAPLTPEKISSADDFTIWFEALAESGPSQQHPLFDWLAEAANLPQMKWFLTQEIAVETGFEDLVAYTQIGLPVQAKLECARNFWDEMGRGKHGSTNPQLLNRVIQGLELRPSIATTVWQSLALSNTMLGLASTRRYAYHSLGALGAVELTASQRTAKISHGMQRLGLDPWVRSYFDLHAALDVAHSRSWIREIIHPMVKANPACAQFIAEGALMRLQCDQLCFNRYSYELGLDEELVSVFLSPSISTHTEELWC